MTSETEKVAIKKIAAFAIGMCGSVKPERQARAAVDAILENYDIVKREDNKLNSRQS